MAEVGNNDGEQNVTGSSKVGYKTADYMAIVAEPETRFQMLPRSWDLVNKLYGIEEPRQTRPKIAEGWDISVGRLHTLELAAKRKLRAIDKFNKNRRGDGV